jgi:hypothetical protein
VRALTRIGGGAATAPGGGLASTVAAATRG